MAPRIVLFSTSSAHTLKIKADISRLKHILDVKKIQYEEVDLAMDPLRREEMVAGSDGSRMLPQLHVNGKFVGDCDKIQELEDFGELSAVLNPDNEAAAAAQ
eukprot:jgi/Astpho2/8694/Aster-x0818